MGSLPEEWTATIKKGVSQGVFENELHAVYLLLHLGYEALKQVVNEPPEGTETKVILTTLSKKKGRLDLDKTPKDRLLHRVKTILCNS